MRGPPRSAMDHAQPWPAPRIVGEDRRRVVGRPVIHNNDGIRLQGLRPHAVETDRDKTRAVADRYQHIDGAGRNLFLPDVMSCLHQRNPPGGI
jgi:hypothetical protein